MSEPPGVALLGPADVRELAHSLDLRPTKARGQNFVIDANTVRRIVARAQVQPEDVVLEVGPGLGSLTLGLLGVAREVIAVEIEQVLANQLPITVADFAPARADRLRVLHTDALQLLTLADPQPTALVANLPYNVAVPVLLESLARFLTLDHGLVMVQKEVADRLCAAPGSKLYGAPTVKLRWYAEVDSAGGVSSSVFWPAPRVASGLVAFRCYPRHDDRALRERAFAAVDAAFGHRRKMLRSALASWAGSTSAAVAAMREAEIDPTARGEQLDASAFRRLAEVLPRPVAGD